MLYAKILLRVVVADVLHDGGEGVCVGRVEARVGPAANEAAEDTAEVFVTGVAQKAP